jgi:hypothetical protein
MQREEKLCLQILDYTTYGKPYANLMHKSHKPKKIDAPNIWETTRENIS